MHLENRGGGGTLSDASPSEPMIDVDPVSEALPLMSQPQEVQDSIDHGHEMDTLGDLDMDSKSNSVPVVVYIRTETRNKQDKQQSLIANALSTQMYISMLCIYV